MFNLQKFNIKSKSLYDFIFEIDDYIMPSEIDKVRIAHFVTEEASFKEALDANSLVNIKIEEVPLVSFEVLSTFLFDSFKERIFSPTFRGQIFKIENNNTIDDAITTSLSKFGTFGKYLVQIDNNNWLLTSPEYYSIFKTKTKKAALTSPQEEIAILFYKE